MEESSSDAQTAGLFQDMMQHSLYHHPEDFFGLPLSFSLSGLCLSQKAPNPQPSRTRTHAAQPSVTLPPPSLSPAQMLQVGFLFSTTMVPKLKSCLGDNNFVLRLKRVKSVMGHLDGCRDFPRLCIGIGNPPGSMDMKAYLLQKFGSVERQQIDKALEQGVEAVRTLVLHGFNNSISRFNLGQKYKYHKVEL